MCCVLEQDTLFAAKYLCKTGICTDMTEKHKTLIVIQL